MCKQLLNSITCTSIVDIVAVGSDNSLAIYVKCECLRRFCMGLGRVTTLSQILCFKSNCTCGGLEGPLLDGPCTWADLKTMNVISIQAGKQIKSKKHLTCPHHREAVFCHIYDDDYSYYKSGPLKVESNKNWYQVIHMTKDYIQCGRQGRQGLLVFNIGNDKVSRYVVKETPLRWYTTVFPEADHDCMDLECSIHFCIAGLKNEFVDGVEKT